MKIFITGIAGFLGSHLADRFIEDGHEVFGIDNFVGGHVENIPRVVDYLVGDCGDFPTMNKALKDIDVVYHCACTAYEGLSVFSPSLVTDNTYGNTVSVLSAAIQNKVKRFVYCSSMARYGNQDSPFTEEMTPKPVDPYGIAKYASEMTIKALCDLHGMEYVIAVPHNIIGPRQKYDDPYRNVAAIMINRMLQGQQPIIYGDGNQVRCFSFIDDVVEPLYLMATLPVSGETINVGPDEGPVTINQLAQGIASLLEFELDPIYVKDRPKEVKFATCSSNKAKKLLNFKAEKNLTDGLSDMIEYIQQKGVKPFNYHIPLEIINDHTPRTWVEKLI